MEKRSKQLINWCLLVSLFGLGFAVFQWKDAGGKVAWIYIGKYDKSDQEWSDDFQKTIEGFEKNQIKVNDVLTISLDVGFNRNKPKFPSYEKGLKRTFPYSISLGVKVNIVTDSVGMRNFTWAEVEIIEV